MQRISCGCLTLEALEKGYIVCACDKNATEAHIPAYIDGTPVCGIGEAAFDGCASLRSVTFDEMDFMDAFMLGGYELGSYAFRDCVSLVGITLPSYVSTIGWGAFMGCSSLAFARFAENTFVDCYAFSRCRSLAEVTSRYCSEGAFGYCESLTHLPVTARTKEIGEDCFEHCTGLVRIIIPRSITRICQLAFRGCHSLQSVRFEDPLGWYFISAYRDTEFELDLSDPERNAHALGYADFDDGVIAWVKRK